MMSRVMRRQRAAQAAGDVVLGRLRGWNIAVGNFFFRYRNALFPVVFVLVVPFLRPTVILGSPTLDCLLTSIGAAVAVVGELVRLATIGFEYIERGGKAGKVYASQLVQGGVYSLTRNPMYLGNALIAIGLTMVAGAPLIYGVVLPFFLFVYQAIVSAEETYLRTRFSEEYDQYCARVHRFLPSWRQLPRALAGMRYDWKRAVRKELSTLTGLLIGLILLPVWRTSWLKGWAAAAAAAPGAIVAVIGVLMLFGLSVYLKTRKQVFY